MYKKNLEVYYSNYFVVDIHTNSKFYVKGFHLIYIYIKDITRNTFTAVPSSLSKYNTINIFTAVPSSLSSR